MPLHGTPGFKAMGHKVNVNGGIYASEFYGNEVYGYQHANTSNNPPSCTVSGVSYVNDIASDQMGDLIVPNGDSHNVNIYQGPQLCGSLIGYFQDPYGQPSDAATLDAVNGVIAVGNIYAASTFGQQNGAGSISVCTLTSGCMAQLTAPNMYEVAGVAIARNGDCWASAEDQNGVASLTYFAGCSGSGQVATGFQNQYFGGLDIDKKGNIVSISAYDGKVYVYSGCNPNCTLVNGPFTLQGDAVFGHLNKSSMAFVTADYQYGQIDVYKYANGTLTYRYSFNNGLTASQDVIGAAFNPNSRE